MAFFSPSFEGNYRPDTLSPDLLPCLAERVRSGLFPMANESRNQYEVREETDRTVRFVSTNLLTGINVGLNDVRISLEGDGSARYEVTYWTWLAYCYGLSMTLVIFLGFFLCAPLLGVEIFPEDRIVRVLDVWQFEKRG